MEWTQADERCKYCGEADYEFGFGPRTLSVCLCCQAVGVHVACEEKAKGTRLTEEVVENREWVCSQVNSCF